MRGGLLLMILLGILVPPASGFGMAAFQLARRTRMRLGGVARHCGARTLAPRPAVLLLRGGGALDTRAEAGGGPAERTLSVSTFNIWCPLFRRMHGDAESRESAHRDLYMQRNREIIELLDSLDSDVICLQEFWVDNHELVDMYKSHFTDRYSWSQLERTGDRGDGLVSLVKHHISVRDRRDIIFRDLGDRVAMLLRLQIPACSEHCKAEVILINTHLLFPHQPYFSIIRMREIRKILGFLELYRQQHREDWPILMAGDFNGAPNEAHYNFLRQRNFTASCGTDTTWITHRNHQGDMVCCDYIWHQNPSDREGPIDDAWRDMVFRSTRQRVMSKQQELLDLGQAFEESTKAKWPVNATAYRYALDRLGFGLAAEHLSDDEIAKLMMGPDSAYIDQDRVLDVKDVFALFDLDSSGGISFEEFSRLCCSLGVRAEREMLQRAFDKIDRKNRDEIEPEEFERWWREEMEPAWLSHKRQKHGAEERSKGVFTKTSAALPPGGAEDDFGFDQLEREKSPLEARVADMLPQREEFVEINKRFCELEMINSRLFPPQLEDGKWENFDMSDHAVLTCEFKVRELSKRAGPGFGDTALSEQGVIEELLERISEK